MYTSYFGLKEKPFSIAPNPRYLYMSEQHQDALAHLLYGLQEGDGFVLLTGDIGTGKTTLCRSLLEQIPDHVEIAYIFNPKLSAFDLLLSICDEFKIALPATKTVPSIKYVINSINLYLLQQHAQGKQSVLIIDEAQNLDADVLEQIRLLTNLETNSKKLLQIILIGQPELRTLFAKPEMEQLAQRITARYHIGPLSYPDLLNYVSHRIYIASGSTRSLFSKSALKELHKVSRGIPRLINTVADRALLAAFVATQQEVTKQNVRKAAHELLDKSFIKASKHFSFRSLFQAFVLFGSLALLTFIADHYFKIEVFNFFNSATTQQNNEKAKSRGLTLSTGQFTTEPQHSALSAYQTRPEFEGEQPKTPDETASVLGPVTFGHPWEFDAHLDESTMLNTALSNLKKFHEHIEAR